MAALLRNNPAAGQAFCRLLTAPLLPGDAGGAAAGAGQRVPVPLERLLELAKALASHLADHPPAADPRSPPRKARGRPRGGAPAAAAAAGKRKKAPAGAAGGDVSDGEGKGGAEADVVAVGAQEESAEAWCSLLAGLCELTGGLGAALKQELCEWRTSAAMPDPVSVHLGRKRVQRHFAAMQLAVRPPSAHPTGQGACCASRLLARLP